MKKVFGIALCLCVAAVCLFIVTRRQPTSGRPSGNTSTVKEQDGAAAFDSSDRRRWTGRAAHRGAAEPEPAAPAIEPGTKTVVHQAADFARGQIQNLITTDGLQLGNDVTYVPRFKPEFQRFGVLVSEEQPVEGGFNVVTPMIETASPENGEVTIEIRTKAVDGDWSTWQEINASDLNKPIQMDGPASAWQYRIYIFANDAAKSPKVKSVTVGTRKLGPPGVIKVSITKNTKPKTWS